MVHFSIASLPTVAVVFGMGSAKEGVDKVSAGKRKIIIS